MITRLQEKGIDVKGNNKQADYVDEQQQCWRCVMREIKFRAYQPEAKGDLKWWSWQELRECDLNTIFKHPEKYHLMQYTGLKDKNGVEIYEGDILACGDGRVPTLIFWDTENNCWSARNLPRREEHKLNKHFKRFIGEVIGNIYDNPEMLEVS